MTPTRKILIIDDNKDIHADFRKVFATLRQGSAEIDQLEADLFAPPGDRRAAKDVLLDVSLDSAYQGEEGLAMAVAAARRGDPYYLAFVDVRMPPGIDGIQTVKRLWQEVPDLQCVICTAYSDYAWEDIVAELGKSGNLLILKKPFDVIEVLHLAQALAEKVDLGRSVRESVDTLQWKVQELTRAESELQRYNEELLRTKTALEAQAAELARKSEQLEIARAGAEAASQAKSHFLANMSHELRTPLSGVIGMLDLLLSTELDAAQGRYTRTAKSSAEVLLHLINDILDFSKIEAGKMELEAIELDLRGTMNEVMELAAHQAKKKGLGVSWYVDAAVPRRLRGDPGRVRQVLTNLASNAVKFTPEGEVIVRAELAGDTEQQVVVRFSVTDTGIGIPPDRIGRLFGSFVQVDSSTTRKYGGTGLGLAISKRLCELMGGEIHVESTLGQGSTFWCTMRLTKQAAGAAEFAAEGHGPGTERQKGLILPPAVRPQRQDFRLLLAEDNEINQEVALEILTRAGFQCDVVGNGKQAVEAVLQRPYDLVLMDCHMPEMDGFEATRVIREREALQQLAGKRAGPLPIIAITANALVGDRERCLAAGMTDYLSKPFRPDLVIQTVQANLAPADPLSQSPREEPPGAAQCPAAPRPFNFESLLERCMGNRELAGSVLSKFCTRAGAELDQIESSIRAGDARQVGLLAHRLKSAAANVSADGVAEAADRLEALGKSGGLEAAGRCSAALRAELDRFLHCVPLAATAAKAD